MNIEAKKSTPEIIFAQQDNLLQISGECYPENSFEFFRPVFDWFTEQFPSLESLTFRINITYLNSSSTKCMLDILDILEESYHNGKKVNVVWQYDKENERSLELAKEFKEDFEMPFEIKPF